MKFRLPALVAGLTLLAVLAVVVASSDALAQNPPEPAPTPAQADLQALVSDIGAKLQSGAKEADTLAAELARFDALLQKYAGQKTEDVAQIALMKAMLFLQVFEDYEQGATQLKRLQADFPATDVAAKLAPLLAELEPMIAARKINAGLKRGAEFPAFSERDLKGQPLELAAYRGKVVLIDFWATWCGPCVAELPNVRAAYEKYKDKGFDIIGISLDQDREQLEGFLQEHRMTWAQYFDGEGWKNKLAKQFGISSIPATYLLGKDGQIVATDLRGEEFEAQLATLLK
ncbi:MAG: TlpA family protein disulfide reductase [Opitutus sp.]|nr:TlpA family protein disulfide reductase [Opitutus sp.]